MDEKLFDYKDRSVGEWLRKIADGSIGLPIFQRSYVWTEKEKIGNYLSALLQGRPTGVFLVLEAGLDQDPQFDSRLLKNVDGEPNRVREQILDGQQRLTSLWQAFRGDGPVPYYLSVPDFGNIQLQNAEIRWPDSAKRRSDWDNPKSAFEDSVVPLSILMDPDVPDDETDVEDTNRIWKWCEKVHENSSDARRLEKKITDHIRRRFLDRREIHYCVLPASTSRDDAINIFVQSNQSSVKVTEFDIAVALATDNSREEDLRDRISEFNQSNPVTRHYLPDRLDPRSEAAISPLGHWMLMAGCLSHLNCVPQKKRFADLVEHLAGGTHTLGDELQQLLVAVKKALLEHVQQGAPTQATLPTLPSVHVLAGLHKTLEKFRGGNPPPENRRVVNKLIKAYIWRAFTTDRYDAQANSRLFEDFKGLRECLEKIGQSNPLVREELPPIFRDDYQTPDHTDLESLEEGKTIGWIGIKNRQARAIVSLTLYRGATDWATGEEFSSDRVRELESGGDLHRHHVFPKALLKEKGFSPDQINHGLNGILLSASTNKSFSRADPCEYLESILTEDYCPSKQELSSWVQSHLVPYDVIASKGSVEKRYRQFIKKRARLVADKFKALTRPPV